MKDRREYALSILFNKRIFTCVIIDPHYEEKHPDINDELILSLVRELNGHEVEAEDEADGFKYFAQEMNWQKKTYRIVLTYCEADFLGVINVFRIREKKQ
jgi:hypothetical protein